MPFKSTDIWTHAGKPTSGYTAEILRDHTTGEYILQIIKPGGLHSEASPPFKNLEACIEAAHAWEPKP